MDRLRPNLDGHIPLSPRHVPHDSVAMATAVGYQRRIAHSGFSSYGCLEAERVIQF